jgi:acetyltransferase/esterase
MDEFVVPGARLHTEVRGDGPVLLLVHGGNGDNACFDEIAGPLAAHFTVVTYVRRGFVRSPMDAPPDDAARIATDVADAAALITHHGAPAFVFGSSSGAIVALDLVTRHPELVRVAVIHEPPILELLADPAAWAARFTAVHATYSSAGLWSAMAQFGEAIGLTRPAPGVTDMSPEEAAMMARLPDNMAFWFAHELETYPAYRTDLRKLEAAGDRLVLAGGRDSRTADAMPYLPNVGLAAQSGHEIVDFPGGHIGYTEHPAEFASQLGELLLRSGR